MKILAKSLSSFLLTATYALAQCPTDTSGLSERNAFEGNLPNNHITAEGARTLDDFVNAAANELFFTEIGASYVATSAGRTLFFRGYGGVSSGTSLPPIDFFGHACNEIGQCVDTIITVRSSGITSPVQDWYTELMSDGIVSGLNSNVIATSYSITATDARGISSPVRDFLPSSILNQQQTQQNYALSTDGNSNLDNRCRNNEGELTGGTAEGGGGATVTPDFEYYFPLPIVPNYWTCWETRTGVACRRDQQ